MSRQLKYKTPEDLQETIQGYLDETPRDEWTVSGLARVVGSKQLLDDYQKRPDYTATVKDAKLQIEIEYEKGLRSRGRAGDIFAMKNFGWTDQSTIKHDVGDRLEGLYKEILATPDNLVKGDE